MGRRRQIFSAKNPTGSSKEYTEDEEAQADIDEAKADAEPILTEKDLIERDLQDHPMFRRLVKFMASKFNMTARQVMDQISDSE